jgi:PIN like domain
MEANVSALERAFHLARSGQVTDVKDIKAQLKPEGYDLGQITGIDDADWISALSAEGRWVVVSGDAKIARRKSEQAAFRNSRLIGFFFAPALSRSKVTKQMQRLLALWDDVEIIADRVAGGAMYELPISGKIRQLKT